MLGELRLFVTFGNKATGSPSQATGSPNPAAEVAGTHLLPARCSPAFLPTGFHPRGASLHLLLFCARLGDLFTNSVPVEAPGHFCRGLREEFYQFHPCRPPPPLVTPHHLRDAQQRHCFPLGHPLLSQLFIREPLITTTTFIDAVSPQRSRFVYMGYI